MTSWFSPGMPVMLLKKVKSWNNHATLCSLKNGPIIEKRIASITEKTLTTAAVTDTCCTKEVAPRVIFCGAPHLRCSKRHPTNRLWRQRKEKIHHPMGYHRMRRCMSHPPGPIFRSRYLHSWNSFRCQNELEISRREVFEDLSFGSGTLLVVEQSSLENLARGGWYTSSNTVVLRWRRPASARNSWAKKVLLRYPYRLQHAPLDHFAGDSMLQ